MCSCALPSVVMFSHVIAKLLRVDSTEYRVANIFNSPLSRTCSCIAVVRACVRTCVFMCANDMYIVRTRAARWVESDMADGNINVTVCDGSGVVKRWGSSVNAGKRAWVLEQASVYICV